MIIRETHRISQISQELKLFRKNCRLYTHMFILNTKQQIIEVDKCVFHNSQFYYCFLWKQRYDIVFTTPKQIIHCEINNI